MERIEIIKLPKGYAKGYLGSGLEKELCEVGRKKSVSMSDIIADMTREKGGKKCHSR